MPERQPGRRMSDSLHAREGKLSDREQTAA